MADGVKLKDGKIIFTKEFEEQNFSVEFEGTMAFEPKTEAHLAWNVKKIPASGVDSLRLTVGGTSELTAEASATAQAQAGFDREVAVTKFSRDFYIPPPPAPIKGKVLVTVNLGLEASVGAEATLTTGEAILTQNAVVTARYKNGSFNFPTNFSNDFQPPTPDFESSARATARPYVRPDVAVVFYEVLGPEIGPEPYLEGVGAVHRGGPEHCESHADIYGGLDAQASVAWGKGGKEVKKVLNIPDIEKEFEGPRTEMAGKTWFCTGELQVDNETAGQGTDSTGYVVEVGDSISEQVKLGESLILPEVKTGDRTVRLTDVASHCAVQGDNPRSVTVKKNETSRTKFAVTCVAGETNLQVSASTSGSDQDSDGYTVTVDDSLTEDIGPEGSATFDSLSDGSHQVELTGVADNCSVQGDNPRDVQVTAGELTTTSYDVSCVRSLPGRIALISDEQGEDPALSVMNADGTGKSELTTLGVNDNGPAMSPEGKWIAFQKEGDLYKIRPDGSGVTQLTDDEGKVNSATWSADGDRIALVLEEAAGNDGLGDIYLINPDGSGLKHITDGDINAGDVSWAPNEGKIAFTGRQSDTGELNIYVINSDGSGLSQVTESDQHDMHPTWSPSGDKIAFESFRSDGFNGDIWTIDPDGSGLFRVTDNLVSEFDPSWGPKR